MTDQTGAVIRGAAVAVEREDGLASEAFARLRDRYELFVEQCQDQDVRVCFSPAKGEAWAVTALLTVVETGRRQGRDVFAWLTEAVRAHLGGRPAPPLLATA